MGKIYDGFEELIGSTPLVRLRHFSELNDLQTVLLAKLEYFNPGGSVKDRIALAMLTQAERDGKIGDGSVIIEPTSGNTGLGLAAVAAAKGYEVYIVMPDTMSIERRKILKAYGAQLILTPGHKGMKGAIEKAKELAEEFENSFIPGQFSNPANPECHYRTTGREIWEDTDGKIDIFVAGVGTGGTISGVGRYLKEKNPAIRIVAVEPDGSPVLSEGTTGPHRIQGIGPGFIPETLNTEIYDEVIRIKNEEAIAATRELARTEGFLTGISSGAALFAARALAKRPAYADARIVTLLPDTGERYLSTSIFTE